MTLLLVVITLIHDCVKLQEEGDQTAEEQGGGPGVQEQEEGVYQVSWEQVSHTPSPPSSVPHHYLYRVAVLENQNKALIEELKSLKELYTGQNSSGWTADTEVKIIN